MVALSISNAVISSIAGGAGRHFRPDEASVTGRRLPKEKEGNLDAHLENLAQSFFEHHFSGSSPLPMKPIFKI